MPAATPRDDETGNVLAAVGFEKGDAPARVQDQVLVVKREERAAQGGYCPAR